MWVEVDLAERRNLLMAMLDEFYVGTVDAKTIVTIRPKPAFRLLFEIATTCEGSGIALINQTPRLEMRLRRLNRVPGGNGGESNSKHGPDGRSCTP